MRFSVKADPRRDPDMTELGVIDVGEDDMVTIVENKQLNPFFAQDLENHPFSILRRSHTYIYEETSDG